MAFGAVRHSRARVSVAVTGVAGPSGGSKDKPVGTVWFGFMVDGRLTSEMRRFDGDRAAVREATVAARAGRPAAAAGRRSGRVARASRYRLCMTWASTPRRGAGPTGGA